MSTANVLPAFLRKNDVTRETMKFLKFVELIFDVLHVFLLIWGVELNKRRRGGLRCDVACAVEATVKYPDF